MLKSLVTVTHVTECVPKNFARVLYFVSTTTLHDRICLFVCLFIVLSAIDRTEETN